MISTCIFCGCGCKLNYVVENNEIKRVLPTNEPVSKGVPCIKGLHIHEIYDKNRIKEPLYRDSKNKEFEKVDWKYAYERIKEEIENNEQDDIMFVSSGEIPNEDNYVLQKFARIIGTNNIDNCARLCHSPTVLAYKEMLGTSANPNLIDDIEKCDLLLLVGTDPFSTYPIAFRRILELKKKGGKIIYLHHLKLKTAKYSDLTILVRPGTEMIAMASVIRYILQRENFDIEGIEELKSNVEEFTFEYASEICGVEPEVLKKMAEMIYNSKNFGFMHGMGLTQQINGTENVKILLALNMLKDGLVLSLRGKINVQGVGDVKAHPWIDLNQIKRFEEAWNVELPKFRGKSLIEGLITNPVKFLWISSMNPAISMPNLNEVHKNLKKMFVVFANYHFNYTTEFSNLILPTPLLIERDGTITNGERRVRLINKVREGFGKREWIILKELAEIFNIEKYFKYKTTKEITKEITKTIPDYSNLNVEELYKGKDQFADKRVKFKRIPPINIKGVNYWELKKHKFLLTSYRSYFHFVSGDLTRESKTLMKCMNEPLLLINKSDAEKLGLKDFDWVFVESDIDKEKIKVKISDVVPVGVVAAVYHFKDFLYNKLVPNEFDDETHIPNYKGVPVSLTPLFPVEK